MAHKRPAGIDLGTTFSVAAQVDQTGRTALIKNSEGDVLTPSAVLFQDQTVVVGKEAKKAGLLKPGRLALWVKRDMGSPVCSQPIDGVYLPPEVVQACILNKLRAEIARAIGPDAAVVITVPAFFDEPRRRATAVAGEIAGLEVLDIVNEPTAAALAFGEHLGMLGPGGTSQARFNVMVYDLGGGTFDVTLLEVHPGGFRTIATDGDVQLGGRDWDMRLADLVCRDFIKEFREDPRQSPVSLQRLLTEVEHAKHTLTARQRATVRLDHAGSAKEVKVSREAFEEATADLLERTKVTTQELLAVARLQWSDVSRLLLVGGSARMPMVAGMLEGLSGIAPDYVVSPDEAVARGAAIYAKYLLDSAEGGRLQPKFRVINVNAHSLGIEGIEQETFEKVNTILIPRNTPLPARVTKEFVTKAENQRSIAVRVLEGESLIPGECTVIGQTVIKDLPQDLPKGYPVEVAYQYTTNGRLHVWARVPGTDREVGLDIERTGSLADARIPQWREAVCGRAGFAVFKALAEEELQPAAGSPAQITGVSLPGATAKALGSDDCASEQAADTAGPEQSEATPAVATSAEKTTSPEGPSTPTDTVTDVKRRRRRPRSVPAEIAKIVIGGLVGLILGQYALWYFAPLDRCDVLGVAESVYGTCWEVLLPDHVREEFQSRDKSKQKGKTITTDGDVQNGTNMR